MILCGCGVTIRDSQAAAAHMETCGQVQADMGSFERKLERTDIVLDFAYAVGYIHVDGRPQRRTPGTRTISAR